MDTNVQSVKSNYASNCRSFVDIELTQHSSAIARWLLEARGRMSREKAAQLIGVSAKTLQRAENGETTPQGDLLLRAAAVYGRSLSELDGFVQVSAQRVAEPGGRYIVESFGYHPDLVAYFRAFERELIRQTASDREVDYALSVIRSPETAQMIQVDDEGNARDLAQMKIEARDVVLALSAWVGYRIGRRAAKATPPIKPKDLPAEMEKRRLELEAERSADKPSRRIK